MANVSIPFKGTFNVSGYTPTGHKLKHEVWIGGLKTDYVDEQFKKFETITPFVVGPGSVSGTITISTTELYELNGNNSLRLEYIASQLDANGTAVYGGATGRAFITFIVQVVDYGNVTVEITSPAQGQVFKVTIV